MPKVYREVQVHIRENDGPSFDMIIFQRNVIGSLWHLEGKFVYQVQLMVTDKRGMLNN